MGTHAFELEKYRKTRKALKKLMDKERYQHTIGVSYTSACLAMCYDVDFETAYLAGLLHDCAKYLTDEEKLAMAEKAGLPIADCERKSPGLLHAALGAYLAETVYGVTDPEILSAIRLHTIGKPEMTMLEKIVFVADYIEPNRPNFPMFKEIRHEAFHDIDKAVYMAAKRSMDYLIEKGTHVLDPRSMDTIDYYGELVKKKEGSL